MKEKADMIYSQNQEMMKELGVSKEAFRVCFEKGYNFEQDEREAKGEKKIEEELSAVYNRLSGSKENKCLLIISQDKNNDCRCFFDGTMLLGAKTIAASCIKSDFLNEMLRVALMIADIQAKKEK